MEIIRNEANLLFNEAENPEPAEQWNLEELTWERMLGLDGSFVFLEHVFWVISLNTLFILMFAYCPYHLGKALFQNIRLGSKVSESHIDGMVNTITGYILFGFVFLLSHLVSSLMNMAKLSQLAKICYMCIKVAILLVFEAMVIPTVCGWWIDICSLSLLNATLSERVESYRQSPGTSVGFHWLFGMLFIFYFATFLLFTKEVLRPGLVWFMRNLNDPEFNPIREMMNQPVMRHIRRFMIAATVFGSIIVLIVWIPVKFLKWSMPDFLPYRVFAISDEPLNHVSLELVTLQVFLPTLLEQTHIKFFLKSVIRLWAECIGYLLDLRGYLLGEKLESGDNLDNAENRANQPGFLRGAANEQADEDDAFNWNLEHINENRNEIRTHHLFHKPSYFKVRVSILLFLVAFSLSAAATMILYFPVNVGRAILESHVGHDRKIHEMYTLFLGLFVCWLPLLAITIVSRWAPMGWRIMLKKLGKRLKIGSKIAFAFITIAGGIALLFGLLFDLVFLTPLRVPLHQTPITYVLVDWAFGAVHVKIAVAFTLLGPNWWLRDALENIYNQGARNFQLKSFLWLVVWPVVSTLIIMLTIPYIISNGLVPLLPVDESLMLRFQRRVYPMFFFGALGMFILHLQYQQLCRLIESIKNSKYLVGQRLVNYDPQKTAENLVNVDNVTTNPIQ
jgi:E3 ubiquitin-protein ligase MARCH6